jgi:aspartate racemase
MHKMANKVEKNINIPLLHIATATAKEIKKDNLKKI